MLDFVSDVVNYIAVTSIWHLPQAKCQQGTS